MAERKSLAEKIEEHNARQPDPAPPPSGQRVRVKAGGRYLGPDLRAVKAKAGDVVTVQSGRYAQSLIDDGLAEAVSEEKPKPSAPRRKRST